MLGTSYRYRNEGSESLNDLTKVTQVMNWDLSQVAWFLGFILHFCCGQMAITKRDCCTLFPKWDISAAMHPAAHQCPLTSGHCIRQWFGKHCVPKLPCILKSSFIIYFTRIGFMASMHEKLRMCLKTFEISITIGHCHWWKETHIVYSQRWFSQKILLLWNHLGLQKSYKDSSESSHIPFTYCPLPGIHLSLWRNPRCYVTIN